MWKFGKKIARRKEGVSIESITPVSINGDATRTEEESGSSWC
jgi:hypothetical protein